MSPHDEIRSALTGFFASIKSGDGAALSSALSALETAHARHRGALDPRLEHFLEGRSYAKALALLGGESEFNRASSPPGGCGGGHA